MTDAGLIFAMLCLIGIFLMWIMLTSDNAVTGLIAGISGMVTWWATAGWFLNLQTDIPGIAWIFYGLGGVCLIIVLFGAFRIIISRRGEILE